MAALGLRYCVQVFYSCGKRGPLSAAVCRPLTAATSPVAEHRLQAHGPQQLWLIGSVVVVRGLQNTGSAVVAHGPTCSTACGIFHDQGQTRNPCIGRRILNHCTTRGALLYFLNLMIHGILINSSKFSNISSNNAPHLI